MDQADERGCLRAPGRRRSLCRSKAHGSHAPPRVHRSLSLSYRREMPEGADSFNIVPPLSDSQKLKGS
jgi:hypothetical protein